MKIGILQAGHSPDALKDDWGDYGSFFEKMLGERGFDTAVYSVVDMEFPQGVQDCDGWLITGSRHGTYDDLPFIPLLEEFIRSAFAAAVPMVGVCFGHQIIAQALGGKVEKFAGGWAVGRTEYDMGGETVALNAWHQDQVTAIPDGAEVCASNDFCKYAALVYDTRAFTVQPHPEFEPGFVKGLAETRGRGVVPDPLLDAAIDNTDRPVDNAAFAQRIARFFKERKL
ncbi:type 1 glutamine amidotransferase [Marivivens marinus]|uniref:type 1 glutamine amidotransferase n=1 Tax=Marivivens marinus TaxID=3110173 RepID=UPI003B846E54